MAIINQALAHGAVMLARQATTTSSTTPSTVTSAAPTASTTDGNANGNQNQTQSSPLLFFVALGFGVVFTNLWIIVGVKYCFRYNARSRQLRLSEDGEPMALENMPRPHRRRREKKLMTMDEVNEKFPMLKYKNWVAGRARDGLPSKGGVSAMPSRANSVRSVAGVVPELPPKERESSDDTPTASATPDENGPVLPSTDGASASAQETQPPSADGQADGHLTSSPADATEPPLPAVPARSSDEHDHTDDEDDEHINAALPPECLGSPGDTCAICIDTLEDDDDVRGLTCGHAFHAVCLDPWLTSRRACCPLCKADYYTPKPRPPVPEPGDGTNGAALASAAAAGSQRPTQALRPQASWIALRSRRIEGRFRRAPDHVVDRPAAAADRRPTTLLPLFGRSRQSPSVPRRDIGPAPNQRPANGPTPAPNSRPNWFAGLRSGFPTFRPSRAGAASQPQGLASPPLASGANPAVSPSQLEAGVATVVR